MSNEPNPPSEWARKRAAGKTRRAKLIERREIYFDLLVSGYSVEEIAAETGASPSAVRRAIGQALAKRRLDAPEAYARLQVARLTKALRCADFSLERGDLNAIAPFVQVVKELNRYHGLDIDRLRLAAPAAVPRRIAPGSEPRLALTHSAGAVEAASFDEKSCAKEQVSP